MVRRVRNRFYPGPHNITYWDFLQSGFGNVTRKIEAQAELQIKGRHHQEADDQDTAGCMEATS